MMALPVNSNADSNAALFPSYASPAGSVADGFWKFGARLPLMPIASPALFAQVPDAARLFLSNGIFLAAATAVLLNPCFTQPADR